MIKKVLSLCDGLSCGLLALKKLGIKVEYHAVEIDKHVRKLADYNLPEIIRWKDDVKEITEQDIIEHGPFDLVLFGTPCQSVSVSGIYCGDNSDAWLNDKSGLLIDCLKVLKLVKKHNPKANFLIENVKMKDLFLKQFNKFIGIEPVLINSELLSAQKRNRYYWSDFEISQPRDKKILSSSIIKDGVLVAYSKSTRYKDKNGKVWSAPAKDRERYVEERVNNNGKANTLVGGLGCCGQSTQNYVLNINPSQVKFNTIEKATLTDDGEICIGNYSYEYRLMTIRECAQMQTIPDWFDFDVVSETQAYKAIGNGWTVDVIAHILKNIKGRTRSK
jgi:site-specific DNA-cytosine methylase